MSTFARYSWLPAGAVFVSACHWLVTLEAEVIEPAPDVVASPSADATPPLPCDESPARVPPRPPEDGTSGGGEVFTTLIAELEMDDLPSFEFKYPGFDLDTVCTCPGTGSCSGPGAGQCDRAGGIDTAVNDLLKRFPVLTYNYRRDVAAGEFATLLRVSEYNGLPNDSRVTVDYFISSRFQPNDDGGRVKPDLTQVQAWEVDRSSVRNIGSLRAESRDADAWVVDGFLVSNLRNDLSLSILPISNSVVVASIGSRQGRRFLESGRWAGVLAAEPFLSNFYARMSLEAECGGGLFQAIRVEVCKSADLSASRAFSPSIPCDALSFNAAVRGVPADIGAVVDRDRKDFPCDAGATRWCAQ